VKIAEFLARNAELSGDAMKWNEEAKIKASMMNEPAWSESFCGRFPGADDLSRTSSTGTSSSRFLLSR
jgi:hypothetical protein